MWIVSIVMQPCIKHMEGICIKRFEREREGGDEEVRLRLHDSATIDNPFSENKIK